LTKLLTVLAWQPDEADRCLAAGLKTFEVIGNEYEQDIGTRLK